MERARRSVLAARAFKPVGEISTDDVLSIPARRSKLVCGKIRDASIRLNRFAGIAALTNGLKIEQHSADGVVLFDFLDGETIKALDDFAPLAGVDAPSVAGTGDDTWMLRWTIAKCGTPLTLQAGEKLVVTVQDDLTDLTEFYLEVQGAWSF